MVLDSINLEEGSNRGMEKLTGKFWRQLVIRQSIDTVITVTLFTLSGFFKRSNQVNLNVICVAVAYFSNAFLSLAVNGYILQKKSVVLLRVISNTIQAYDEMKAKDATAVMVSDQALAETGGKVVVPPMTAAEIRMCMICLLIHLMNSPIEDVVWEA
jgi:hypothetical protein